MKINRKPLFNEFGDIEVSKKRMINGNTTNLNDFNNMKYGWVSDWYRQAMNNFWIPEEINLSQDLKDYFKLNEAERSAYDKILSFLIFLDSIQTANLSNISNYITASEVNLCLTIQAFQEAVHSPEKRNEILYQWKDDKILLERNKFIGELYNNFLREPNKYNLVKTIMANYILEGIYFYSGFMFFYNLERNGKMPGSAQEIRYINRDENTHLWLFRNIIKELQKEEPGLFNDDLKKELVDMMKKGVKNEIAWGHYVIGDNIQGINKKLIEDYIKYLGNLRLSAIGLPKIYDGYDENPALWVDVLADANSVKTDFFEAKSTAYAKAATLIDDL